MGHQIRALMAQGGDPLSGEVEADETYYGKGGKNATKFKNKQAVLGVVELSGFSVPPVRVSDASGNPIALRRRLKKESRSDMQTV